MEAVGASLNPVPLCALTAKHFASDLPLELEVSTERLLNSGMSMTVHYDEIKLSVSFSLKRKLVAGVRERAKRLGVPMSAYVSLLIHNDMVRGRDAPLELLAGEE